MVILSCSEPEVAALKSRSRSISSRPDGMPHFGVHVLEGQKLVGQLRGSCDLAGSRQTQHQQVQDLKDHWDAEQQGHPTGMTMLIHDAEFYI